MVLLCCVLRCFGALAQTAKVDSSAMQVLRIDPSSAVGAPVSEIFDEVQFIPLETTKESVFGSVNQFEVLGNTFVVFDHDTKSVLFFAKDGKYKSKIDASKLPPAPDSKDRQIFGFELMEEDGISYICVYTPKLQLYYSEEGKLVKEKKMISFGERRLYFNDNASYVRQGYTTNEKDTIAFELGLYDKEKGITTYFPYHTNRFSEDEFISSGNNFQFNEQKDEFLFTNYYEYNIYRGNSKSLSLAFKLIFPMSATLPADFVTNPIYRHKKFQYFQNNGTKIFGVGSPFVIGDNLIFKIGAWGDLKKNTLAYNLKTGGLLSVNDIEPDEKSYFLPINDTGVGYDCLIKGFLLYKEGYLYTRYSSFAMFAFKEQSAGKNAKYNTVLTDYFKTQNKKSNPVIVLLKPKKN